MAEQSTHWWKIVHEHLGKELKLVHEQHGKLDDIEFVEAVQELRGMASHQQRIREIAQRLALIGLWREIRSLRDDIRLYMNGFAAQAKERDAKGKFVKKGDKK